MIQPIKSMKNAFDLTGKTAIITGGNRGLGLGIGVAFAECGANIAVLCRDAKKAEEALAELRQFGTRCESFSCNVTDIKSVRQAVAEVYAAFETVDILVNNAGVSCVSELL
ncbi:MAG: SDR family NAD(P)-dependent oxidoreductase, partial [Oscillospiraceae bacterium]|nr:SDR family NAD(P)-dependent oxidoreductase [Oscillospiraceae bacterium]